MYKSMKEIIIVGYHNNDNTMNSTFSTIRDYIVERETKKDFYIFKFSGTLSWCCGHEL